MSYDELKNSITKEDKVVIWGCDTCIKHCGFGGFDKMSSLSDMLSADGYEIIKKELLGVSCVPDLINDRKTWKTKKHIFEQATAIIALTCDTGWDEISEAFPNLKIIKPMASLGVGIISEERGILLTNPFEDIDIDPNIKGTPIKEVAEKLNLYDTFFDADQKVEAVKNLVEISVNGNKIMAEEGENLLQECLNNGIKIPHLCYTESLGGEGACRLCLVKIEGMRGMLSSCTMKVEKGMEVTTEDEELFKTRQMLLELVVAADDHNCMFCSQNNKCELQNLVHDHGIESIRLRKFKETKPIDDSNPALTIDMNKCILCSKCVRACDEIAGRHNLAFLYRGTDTIVAAGVNKTMKQSDCVTCLACVFACPTGAIHERQMKFSGPEWKKSKAHGYYG